ncbi:MAG: hypothetical protein WBG88_09995 [Mesorhizobium sp.]
MRRLAAAVPALIALLAFMPAANAHGFRPAGPAEGIRIESLTHGQMAVLARYRGQIMNLAASRTDTDEPFRRVMNYASIQFSVCLWGLAPGSISDEASPFNECAHAYLAATRSVLMRMQAMAGPHPRVDALASRIDADMVRNRASLVLCQFSDEAYHTGSVVYPHWPGAFSHPPSLAALGALGCVVAGGFFAMARPVRQRPPSA